MKIYELMDDIKSKISESEFNNIMAEINLMMDDITDPPIRTEEICEHDETITITYKKDGELHRLCGPALICTNESGVETLKEEWYKNGLRHRLGGPAIIYDYTDHDGYRIKNQSWYENGLRHRLGGPAVLSSYKDFHTNTTEEWYEHDKLHRDNGLPARINEGPMSRTESWYEYDKLHRTNAPAVICYSMLINGGATRKPVPVEEMWFQHGSRHRDDGPAYVKRCRINGNVETDDWYKYGKLFHN